MSRTIPLRFETFHPFEIQILMSEIQVHNINLVFFICLNIIPNNKRFGGLPIIDKMIIDLQLRQKYFELIIVQVYKRIGEKERISNY